VIYLDACALVKLLREEDESRALQQWLDERPDEQVVTSEVATAEVLRVVRRNNHTDQGVLIDEAELERELDGAAEMLSAVTLIAVDRALLHRAGAVETPMLRTLDAIHLVSAMELARADPDVITYERRLGAIARAVGLTVVSPG
jgi:uncharacterized protein